MCEWRSKITDLNNGSDQFSCWFGLHNGSTASEPTTGFYFRYTAADGTSWQAVCANGGPRTVVNTNVVADVDFHRFRITSDGGGVARFYIDDVQVAVITSSLPSVNRHTPNAMIKKTAGTTSADGSVRLLRLAVRAEPMTSPNVLVILSDDQRFDFLPYMPNTRNLISFQGRDFVHTRCNVAVCEPTRVSLITGQYSIHHGAGEVAWETVPHDHSNTIGAWMQAASYRTGLIGKYLNGTPPLMPKPGGWDTWLQFDETTGYNAFGYQVCDGVTLSSPSQFQMDYVHDQAVAFVQGSEPWFLLCAPTSPHIPFDPDPRDLFAWSDVRWPLVIEDDVSDKPSWIANQPPLAGVGARRVPRDGEGAAA